MNAQWNLAFFRLQYSRNVYIYVWDEDHQDRDAWVKEHDELCNKGLTTAIGHQQGQVLKELFVPFADNGPKTSHLRWRCAIANFWQGEEHELAFSLGEFVRNIDENWIMIQRLWPAKDWRAIRAPEHWEELQFQIDAELSP